jgi:hypothetical protein
MIPKTLKALHRAFGAAVAAYPPPGNAVTARLSWAVLGREPRTPADRRASWNLYIRDFAEPALAAQVRWLQTREAIVSDIGRMTDLGAGLPTAAAVARTANAYTVRLAAADRAAAAAATAELDAFRNTALNTLAAVQAHAPLDAPLAASGRRALNGGIASRAEYLRSEANRARERRAQAVLFVGELRTGLATDIATLTALSAKTQASRDAARRAAAIRQAEEDAAQRAAAIRQAEEDAAQRAAAIRQAEEDAAQRAAAAEGGRATWGPATIAAAAAGVVATGVAWRTAGAVAAVAVGLLLCVLALAAVAYHALGYGDGDGDVPYRFASAAKSGRGSEQSSHEN